MFHCSESREAELELICILDAHCWPFEAAEKWLSWVPCSPPAHPVGLSLGILQNPLGCNILDSLEFRSVQACRLLLDVLRVPRSSRGAQGVSSFNFSHIHAVTRLKFSCDCFCPLWTSVSVWKDLWKSLKGLENSAWWTHQVTWSPRLQPSPAETFSALRTEPTRLGVFWFVFWRMWIERSISYITARRLL